MKVAVYGKSVNLASLKSIQLIISSFEAKNVSLLLYQPFLSKLLEIGCVFKVKPETFEGHGDLVEGVSFLISVGGDGTFLDTVSLVKHLNIPILGINTGRLGFLSNTGVEEIEEATEALISGNYHLENRTLLCLESDIPIFGEENFALNEVSILKKDSSSMITIHVKLDGKHLNSYWTDGLIISTATGSTAYSLSCGGPIIMPGSGNFVITPIASHNLNVRPIVISDSSILSVEVVGRTEPNLIALDSRSAPIENHQLLTIKKAAFSIRLVQLEKHSFIQSLKNKLNWGLDKRNQ